MNNTIRDSLKQVVAILKGVGLEQSDITYLGNPDTMQTMRTKVKGKEGDIEVEITIREHSFEFCLERLGKFKLNGSFDHAQGIDVMETLLKQYC